MKFVMVLLLLGLSLFANDLSKYESFGVYTGQTTSYLYSIEEVKVYEMRFIYSGKLKTLKGSVPVKVLLHPLDDMSQAYALRSLLGINIDKLREDISGSSNMFIIESKTVLLATLSSTIGALAVVDNQLVYNHNGDLIKIKVVQ
jgi:hypothetical protein